MQSRSLKSGKLVRSWQVQASCAVRSTHGSETAARQLSQTARPQKRPVTKPMCVYISGSNSLHFTSPILHKVEAVYLTKSRESRECMQICEISGDTPPPPHAKLGFTNEESAPRRCTHI